MDNLDGSRPRGKSRLDQGGIDVQPIQLHVDELGHKTRGDNAVGRRNEGEGGSDDLVPALGAGLQQGGHRHDAGVRP